MRPPDPPPPPELAHVDWSRRMREAAQETARRIREEFGDRVQMILLYGSVARGEADINSDVDMMVVVHQKDMEIKGRVLEIASRVGLQRDVFIAPVVSSGTDWVSPFFQATVFCKNLLREGLEL